MKDLISIIIPIYNGEKYLLPLFESIKSQKYKNFEVLLINDGSTDNTAILCKKVIKEDKRFKYYEKNNSGVSDSRNMGIKLSKGNYICFVDSDDIISNNYLMDFVNHLKGNNDILLCCNIIKLNDIKIMNYQKFIKEDSENKRIEFKDSEKYDFIYTKFGGYLCNKIYSTKIIKDNKLLFNNNVGMCEDLLFIHQYMKYSKKAVCFYNCNYVYRVNDSTASKKLSNTTWFSIYDAYDLLLLQKDNYSESHYKRLNYSYISYLYQGLYRLKFIKKDIKYNNIKKDLLFRIDNIDISKNNFSLKEMIHLFFYKHFNNISFYFKLKKERNI